MSCHISYVHYRFNTYTEESISVGMVMIDNETCTVRIKLSDLKLKIASKILPNKNVFKFFKYSITKL